MDIEFLIEKLLEAQKHLTDEARLKVWERLQKDYCIHCGCLDPNCKCECWNEE